MSTPTTALDSRFSEPGASPTSWDDTLRALEAAELFWITTVRADGRPHVSPLVAVWLDDAIHFSTGADEQKAHNLRANPRIRQGHLHPHSSPVLIIPMGAAGNGAGSSSLTSGGIGLRRGGQHTTSRPTGEWRSVDLREVNMTDLARFAELVSLDHGLGVVVTARTRPS